MAHISKRRRYEILRRDNFSCTYCGAKAPDVTLHVDHVVPVALGGTDLPSNLATACEDCNLGKASSSPSDETLDAVEQSHELWQAAVSQAAVEALNVDHARRDYVAAFIDAWPSYYGVTASMEAEVGALYTQGLPVELMVDSVWIAVGARHVVGKVNKYRYFRAVCRNRVEELHHRAEQIMREES